MNAHINNNSKQDALSKKERKKNKICASTNRYKFVDFRFGKFWESSRWVKKYTSQWGCGAINTKSLMSKSFGNKNRTYWKLLTKFLNWKYIWFLPHDLFVVFHFECFEQIEFIYCNWIETKATKKYKKQWCVRLCNRISMYGCTWSRSARTINPKRPRKLIWMWLHRLW